MLAAHIASLIIYVAIIIVSVWGLFYIKYAEHIHHMPFTLKCFLVLATLQACTFIYLQLDWVSSGYNEAVGGTTSLLWLMFDYFNGLALLSFVVSTLIYLKWCKWCKFNLKRRRDDI